MNQRAIRFALAAATALGCAAPGAGEEIDLDWLGEIPKEYHGRWNTDPRSCTPFTGRYRLEIGANRIVAGGDPFQTQYLARQEDGGVYSGSKYVGPARPWDRSETFNLAQGGKVLINRHAGRVIRRYRCP